MKNIIVGIISILFIGTVSAQNADSLNSPVNISVVCLLVNDYDEAITYYTEKLGFKVSSDVKYGSKQRWVTLSATSNGGIELSLGLATTDTDKQIVGKQGGQYPFFVLIADDFNVTYNDYKSKRIDFLSEPKAGPGGTAVTFKDLYGNIIYLRAAQKQR
jgi:catechol 2,3-dioxygenase-like lactoylglutathione lyase family enzyme